jgi:PAS domain-containing protein
MAFGYQISHQISLTDMLPVPILVIELKEESLNHNIIYSNNVFSNIIGWSLEEIPDKNHWWKKHIQIQLIRKLLKANGS